MRKIRIYHPEKITHQATVVLSNRAQHHVQNVLRMHKDDKLYLFDGSGYEFAGIITEFNKQNIIVAIQSKQHIDVESPLTLHLGQALLRNEKMDFVIQKAVELGVNAITPVLTERCNIILSKERQQKRIQHWQQIIISACEQSGRVILPMIHAPMKYSEWVTSINVEQKFLLHPIAQQQKTTNKTVPKSIAIMIGPEGGLSEQEYQQGSQAGFEHLQFGPRVFRTETAALVSIAIMQYRWGDYQDGLSHVEA